MCVCVAVIVLAYVISVGGVRVSAPRATRRRRVVSLLYLSLLLLSEKRGWCTTDDEGNVYEK